MIPNLGLFALMFAIVLFVVAAYLGENLRVKLMCGALALFALAHMLNLR